MSTESIKVLIVDDEPLLLEISKEFLEGINGFQVETSLSAKEAIVRMRNTAYDAVVSDYQMPETDGIELLKSIRLCNDPIPFILFTGKGREDVAIDALNSGADFYLQKGGDPKAQFAELANMIEKSVQRHQMELDLKENEQKLKSIFNSANDAILIIDSEGSILEINDVGCDWLGYTRQEMLQKNVQDIESVEYAKQVPDRMKQVMGNGIALLETEWVRKNGMRLPVEVSARRITYANRQALLSVARDITRRKLAVKKITESENQYRQLMEKANDAILIHEISPEGPGRLIEVNDRACQMLGYSRDKLLRKGIPDLDVPEQRDNMRAITYELYSSKTALFKTDLLSSDGRRIPAEISANLIEFKGRDVVLSIIHDITQRKQDEEALRNTQAQLRLAMDLARLVHWEYDVDKDLFTFDDQFYALYGSSEEKEGGQLMSSATYASRFIPPEEASIVAEETAKAISTTDPNYFGNVTHTIIKSDGERRIINVRFGVIKDTAGRTVKTFGANQDITELKQVEEALRESEKKYRLLVESAAEVIVVVQDGKICLANPIAVAMTGLTEQELTSKSFQSFIHPDDLKMVAENYQKRTKGEAVPSRYAFRMLAKDGSIHWMELSAVAIDWQGRPATLNFLTNISERKRTESALRESEERYRAFFATSKDCVFITTPEGRWVDFNDAAVEMFGYESREDLMKISIPFLYADPRDREMHTRYIREHECSFEYPVNLKKKDGTIVSALITSVVRKDAAGSIINYQGSIQDVTERKRAEETLWKMAARNDAILAAIPDIMTEVDEHKRITWVNQPGLQFFGEDVVGHEASYYFEGEQETYAKVQPLFDGSDEIIHLESWQRRKDGEKRLLSWMCKALKDEQGRVTGALSSARDITDLKRAEEALQESIKRYDLVMDGSLACIWDSDLVKGSIHFSPQWKALRGYTDSEIGDNRMEWTSRVHPDDAHRVMAAMQAYLAGKTEIYEAEYRTRCKDGSFKWVLDRGKAVRDATGKAIRNVGSEIDITERKHIEEALRISENRFEQLAEQSGTVTWEIDADGLITYVSRASESVWGGFLPEELVGKKHFYELTPEAERESFKVLIFELVKHKARFVNLENPMKAKDGRIIWVSTNGIPLLNSDGTLRGYEGSDTDITERKRAEEALRQANIKLGILNSITRHDINNQIMVINGFIELCRRREKDPDLTPYLDRMSRAVANVHEQIDFTKVYQDLGNQAPAWASVSGQLAVAFAMLNPSGVVLEDRTGGIEILTDPLAEKVPYNLIDNSIRHGGQVTRIAMTAEQVGDAMLVVYEDDGVGISVEDKKRLFEKGFGKNTGLGLFLMREILAITGITITEKGRPGKGVRFEMLVPPGAWRRGSYLAEMSNPTATLQVN